MVGWDGTEYWRCMGNYFLRFSALFWLLGFVARLRDEWDERDEITVCIWTSMVEMKVQSAREDVLLLRQWNFLLQVMGQLCWRCGFTARIETWDEVCPNSFILRFSISWIEISQPPPFRVVSRIIIKSRFSLFQIGLSQSETVLRPMRQTCWGASKNSFLGTKKLNHWSCEPLSPSTQGAAPNLNWSTI